MSQGKSRWDEAAQNTQQTKGITGARPWLCALWVLHARDSDMHFIWLKINSRKQVFCWWRDTHTLESRRNSRCNKISAFKIFILKDNLWQGKLTFFILLLLLEWPHGFQLLFHLLLKTNFFILFFSAWEQQMPYTYCLSLFSFCCLSVLRALKHPSPGEGEKEEPSPIVLVFQVTTFFSYLPLISVFLLLSKLDDNMLGYSMTMWFRDLYPIMYLRKVRKTSNSSVLLFIKKLRLCF